MFVSFFVLLVLVFSLPLAVEVAVVVVVVVVVAAAVGGSEWRWCQWRCSGRGCSRADFTMNISMVGPWVVSHGRLD